MRHWTRVLIPFGFEWVSEVTSTSVLMQIRDQRWTATLSIQKAVGAPERTQFFVEDGYDASLQKCLLYVWRALASIDKSTFDLGEALADLRRYVP
jgi:hypothetical protein